MESDFTVYVCVLVPGAAGATMASIYSAVYYARWSVEYLEQDDIDKKLKTVGNQKTCQKCSQDS